MPGFAQQLTALLPTLIRSNGIGGLTTAADMRAYESQVIQAVAALELRARGSRIFTGDLVGSPPDPAMGLEGDLFIERTILDLYTYLTGQWVFLVNLKPRPSPGPGPGGSVQKLYATTGQNTDGSLTQKAASDALAALPIRLSGGANSLVAGAAGNTIASATLESAILGGNGNRILEQSHDSGIVGGANVTIDTPLASAGINGADADALTGASGAVGGLFVLVGAAVAATVAGLYNTVYGYAGAIIGGVRLTLPLGAWRSAIIGGTSFTAPALPDTLFTPQAYLFQPGGGVSLVSLNGAKRKTVALDNDGSLTLDGAKLMADAGTERYDLATFPGLRTNTLFFEERRALSNPILGSYVVSFSAQVLAGTPLAAVAPVRTGTPAAISAAINADIAALTPAQAALYGIRFSSVPTASTEESHVFITM